MVTQRHAVGLYRAEGGFGQRLGQRRPGVERGEGGLHRGTHLGQLIHHACHRAHLRYQRLIPIKLPFKLFGHRQHLRHHLLHPGQVSVAQLVGHGRHDVGELGHPLQLRPQVRVDLTTRLVDLGSHIPDLPRQGGLGELVPVGPGDAHDLSDPVELGDTFGHLVQIGQCTRIAQIGRGLDQKVLGHYRIGGEMRVERAHALIRLGRFR
ncbi:Uncharacterised protein [Mycobacteroides abscessus subsp. massiliense]|nr:Uncharacterised protein [Mycobacteroides abscessus subsp. massiliense]